MTNGGTCSIERNTHQSVGLGGWSASGPLAAAHVFARTKSDGPLRVASRRHIRYAAQAFVFTTWQWSSIGLKITTDSVLVQDEAARAADLDGGVVVLSMRAGAYFGFNRVATEIWNMLDEPHDIGQIFDSLAERYEVDAKVLARDVLPFLQAMIEHRLLRVIDTGEARWAIEPGEAR